MSDRDYTEIMKIAFQAEGAINDESYTTILGVVLVTTILAPFIIKPVFARGHRAMHGAGSSAGGSPG